LAQQKEEKVEMTGEIVEALRNGMFRIQLDNGHETLGYTAGKMRRYRIRMNPGDRVRIELSAYDLGRGRIVYRMRPGDEREALASRNRLGAARRQGSRARSCARTAGSQARARPPAPRAALAPRPSSCAR
jgi:translation initiation factor IF-1